MASRTEYSCPHCRQVYKVVFHSVPNYRDMVGAPIEICPRCQKPFLTRAKYWVIMTPQERHELVKQLRLGTLMLVPLSFPLCFVFPAAATLLGWVGRGDHGAMFWVGALGWLCSAMVFIAISWARLPKKLAYLREWRPDDEHLALEAARRELTVGTTAAPRPRRDVS
jgi:hypothetical protein